MFDLILKSFANKISDLLVYLNPWGNLILKLKHFYKLESSNVLYLDRHKCTMVQRVWYI